MSKLISVSNGAINPREGVPTNVCLTANTGNILTADPWLAPTPTIFNSNDTVILFINIENANIYPGHENTGRGGEGVTGTSRAYFS